MYHAPNRNRAPSVNVAQIINALRFATQTTTACPERFAARVARASQAVRPTPIVLQHVSVPMASASAALVSLVRHSVVLISMNAQRNHAIRAPFAPTHPAHSVARVPNRHLVTRMPHQAAVCPINVCAMVIAHQILNVHKANARIHARTVNAAEMLYVKCLIIARCAAVPAAILAIHPIRKSVASALSVCRMRNAASTNNAVRHLINATVSRDNNFYSNILNHGF